MAPVTPPPTETIVALLVCPMTTAAPPTAESRTTPFRRLTGGYPPCIDNISATGRAEVLIRTPVARGRGGEKASLSEELARGQLPFAADGHCR